MNNGKYADLIFTSQHRQVKSKYRHIIFFQDRNPINNNYTHFQFLELFILIDGLVLCATLNGKALDLLY